MTDPVTQYYGSEGAPAPSPPEDVGVPTKNASQDKDAQAAASEGFLSSGTPGQVAPYATAARNKKLLRWGGSLLPAPLQLPAALAANSTPTPPPTSPTSRSTVDPADLPGTPEYDRKQYLSQFDLGEGYGYGGKIPTAPQPKPKPQVGGGTPDPYAAVRGQVADDYNEQLRAMYAEKGARQDVNQAEVAGEGQIAQFKRDYANEMGQRVAGQQNVGQHYMNEIYKLTHAYADGAVDPDKFWHDKNPVQKIATIVGAALLSAGSALTGGGASAGVNAINGMVDRSIAIQQMNLDRKRVAAGHIENLYQLFLQQSKSENEAFDKTKAVLLDAAITDVARSVKAAQGKVQGAEMDKFIASLRLQRDEILSRLHAQARSGGAGPVGGPSGFIPIEQGAHVVDTPNGPMLIGMGGEQVAQSVSNSYRAAQEADNLVQLMDQMPNPLQNPQAYQEWYGHVTESMKNIGVLGAGHMGSGGQGNVARMKAYLSAIAGPEGEPQGTFGSMMLAPQLMVGLKDRIKAAASDFSKSVRADNEATLQAHNAIPGNTAFVNAHGTGEFKGMGVTKQVFVPGQGRNIPPPQAGQRNPYQSFQASQ